MNADSTYDSNATTPTQSTQLNDFTLWVDGVGGFLICCGIDNKIGQAIPDSAITIPLRGDLDREHARIETIEDRHLLHPIGNVAIDSYQCREPTVLIHNQTILFGDAVAIGYRKPHPLSSSAVLDFVSRHRTFPWSDAVIIAGETVLLGAQSRNHIVCPHWKHELILFRRQNQWFCKTKADAYIDGEALTSESCLRDKSHITGEDFSFSVEAV